MTKILKECFIKKGWQEGNDCLFKKINNSIYYYNISSNTFSVDNDGTGFEEYLGKGTLGLLSEIEKGEI